MKYFVTYQVPDVAYTAGETFIIEFDNYGEFSQYLDCADEDFVVIDIF